MDQHQLQKQLGELKHRFDEVLLKLKPEQMQQELDQLQGKTTQPEFWNDQRQAQSTMQKIGDLQRALAELTDLGGAMESLDSDLQDELSDEELLQLLQSEIASLTHRLDKLELRTFLSGKYDHSNAIFSLHAGQGGTEANDWVSMLLRMYTRYFDSVGWRYEVVHEVRGTEAGFSTVTLEVHGDYAYGYLKGEHGTHRLVRNSPFNSAGLRQTSFAGVEVMPLVDDEITVEIKPEDLEFSAVRSSGAGGQNVNKVATSVRIVHLPTGIAVTSSTSRSQAQNRENAMRLLRSKLIQIEEEKRLAEESQLKGQHKVFGWGNQIRNYVLQPYRLVKDLRTNVETANSDAVLDGDIQPFLDACVRQL